jgi:hypothetical protein
MQRRLLWQGGNLGVNWTPRQQGCPAAPQGVHFHGSSLVRRQAVPLATHLPKESCDPQQG